MDYIPGMWMPGDTYEPCAAGSIDGTDDVPHDRGIRRAMIAADVKKCMSLAYQHNHIPPFLTTLQTSIKKTPKSKVRPARHYMLHALIWEPQRKPSRRYLEGGERSRILDL